MPSKSDEFLEATNWRYRLKLQAAARAAERRKKQQAFLRKMQARIQPLAGKENKPLLDDICLQLRRNPSGHNASKILDKAVRNKEIPAGHADWYWREAEWMAYGKPYGEHNWYASNGGRLKK